MGEAEREARRRYDHGGFHGERGLIEDCVRAFVKGAEFGAAQTAALCCQCGERESVMVKIGTTDGWCTACLDEAAETDAHEAEVAAGALREYADHVMAEVAVWDERIYPNRWSSAREKAHHARARADALTTEEPT